MKHAAVIAAVLVAYALGCLAAAGMQPARHHAPEIRATAPAPDAQTMEGE